MNKLRLPIINKEKIKTAALQPVVWLCMKIGQSDSRKTFLEFIFNNKKMSPAKEMRFAEEYLSFGASQETIAALIKLKTISAGTRNFLAGEITDGNCAYDIIKSGLVDDVEVAYKLTGRIKKSWQAFEIINSKILTDNKDDYTDLALSNLAHTAAKDEAYKMKILTEMLVPIDVLSLPMAFSDYFSLKEMPLESAYSVLNENPEFVYKWLSRALTN